MKKFLFKTILFLLPIIAVPLVYLVRYGVPPPKLSNSLSLNAKILSLKERHLTAEVNVLSFGSSMNLNNVHSETMRKYFGSKYLNIASWGQNIEEDFNLIKIFAIHYRPSIIIISSNYMDFNNNSKEIKYDLIDSYLFKNGALAYKEITFKYLLEESGNYFYSKKDEHSYTSLMYDDLGGVNFEKTNFNIEQERWTGNNIKEFNFDMTQYLYLDSISQFCLAKSIDLAFIQSPFRNGYYTQLDEQALDILRVHESKVESILRDNNQIFIYTENESWEDALFVDYSHLSKEGSEIYTEYFLNEIRKRRRGTTL